MQDETLYSFGPFLVDATQRVLLRGTEPQQLMPKDIDVLIAFVERHGEIVDKRQLLDRVWKGVSVEECNISQHVATLRRILGDDAHEPKYIETVPRRGYRFVAKVARVSRSSIATVAPLPEPRRSNADPAPSAYTLTPTPAPTPTPTPAPTPTPTLTPTPTPTPIPLPLGAPPVVRRWPLRRAPTALLALIAVGLGWGIGHPYACSPAPPIRSIAILPFANLTGDAHLDDVAAALASSLTSDLGEVRGLRVEGADPAKGSHQVEGVDALVETALLRGEGRMRLVAELIDARTGRLVWAEVFDSDPASWPEAGKRVAQAIVARLAAGSAGDRASGLSAGRAAAHREYALAREYLSRRTPQVVPEALEHSIAATQLDPGFALALAGVAEAYLLGAEQRVLAPAEAHAAAEAAARRALDLEPELAQAHAALGEVAAARWDFEAAEESYRLALSLDPGIARVHEHYAALLTVQDRHEEAIAEARVARDLEPSCPAAAAALAAAYYHAGQNDEAIERALAALRMTPRFPAAYDVLGWAHQAKGHDAEAVAAFGEAVRLSGRNPTYVAALARAHARAGARKEAQKLLSELERGRRERAASPLDVAEVLAALGESDRALGQVERAVAEGTPWLPRVDAGLSLEALHDHARYRELVGRMRRAAALAREPGRSTLSATSIAEPKSGRK